MQCKPSIKVGDVFETGNYGSCEVIKYEGYKNVTVRFLDTGTEVVTRGCSLKKGKVKDRYCPSIYGVGYTGDATMKVLGVVLRSYRIWISMLSRCYSRNHVSYPSYGGSGITVHKDWHNYSNFKEWYDSNVPEGYQVDKDLLRDSSKIYSEETCCALPNSINYALICGINNKRSGLPYGVSNLRNMFQSQITMHGIKSRLGIFDTPEEAHQVWRSAKTKYIQELAEESHSKGEITERVYDALMRWEPPEH